MLLLSYLRHDASGSCRIPDMQPKLLIALQIPAVTLARDSETK